MKKEELIRQWRIYHDSYSSSIEKYYVLLNEKRELGIYPLYTIPKNVIREYPNIPFLDIETESEAKLFLDSCGCLELARISNSLENLKIDYSYNTIQVFIADSMMQINRKKSGFRKINLFPSAEVQKGRHYAHYNKNAPSDE